MSVDWSKPIQTRDGRKARYVGQLRHSKWTRIVASEDPQSGYEHISTHSEGGWFADNDMPDRCDIINVPEPEPWMVKAAEECAKVAMLAGPMDVRDEVAKEFIDILMKHAKEAV